MSAPTEQKMTYSHSLLCIKGGHKFSIDSEDPNNSSLDLPKMSCPMCGENVQLDPSVLGGSGVNSQKSIESRRKDNVERTRMALQMAAEAKRGQPEEEMVTVQYGGGTRSRFGTPGKVSKKVLESLEEKVGPALAELE